MRIVDTHNHLWKCSGEHFSWITDELAAIRKDFVIEDLLTVLGEQRIDASLLVQAVPELAETYWLLDIANATPEINGVIGWADIAKGAAVMADLMALRAASDKLKGIRYMSQGLPATHLLEPDFIEGVRCVGRQGLVYELLITATQLEAAEQLIAACPEVRFVIEHGAKPDIRHGEIALWAARLARIACGHQNVYCKLSGLVTEGDYTHWDSQEAAWQEIAPYMRKIFELFGARRVMFGSDWPVSLLAFPYGELLQLYQRFLRENPCYHADDFFHNVADKVYSLQ